MKNVKTNSKIIAFLLIASLLSSCSHNKNRKIYTPETCPEIFAELEYAKHFESQIHKDDQFKFKYLLFFPGMWEIYTIIRDENHVKKRKKELYHLAKIQKCYGEGQNPSLQQFDQNLYQYEQQNFTDKKLYEENSDLYRKLEEEQFYKQYEREMLQY